MQLKPKLLRKGDRHEGVVLKSIGNIFLVGLSSDPYEPPKYFYFDDEKEAEGIFERLRKEGWDLGTKLAEMEKKLDA